MATPSTRAAQLLAEAKKQQDKQLAEKRLKTARTTTLSEPRNKIEREGKQSDEIRNVRAGAGAGAGAGGAGANTVMNPPIAQAAAQVTVASPSPAARPANAAAPVPASVAGAAQAPAARAPVAVTAQTVVAQAPAPAAATPVAANPAVITRPAAVASPIVAASPALPACPAPAVSPAVATRPAPVAVAVPAPVAVTSPAAVAKPVPPASPAATPTPVASPAAAKPAVVTENSDSDDSDSEEEDDQPAAEPVSRNSVARRVESNGAGPGPRTQPAVTFTPHRDSQTSKKDKTSGNTTASRVTVVDSDDENDKGNDKRNESHESKEAKERQDLTFIEDPEFRTLRGTVFAELTARLKAKDPAIKLDAELIKSMMEGTEIILKPTISLELEDRPTYLKSKISVVNNDSLSEALSLQCEGYRPVILMNLATSPNDALQKGMSREEAAIYCRTNYGTIMQMNSLKGREKLQFQNLAEKNKYVFPQFFNGACFTPDVQVVAKSEDLLFESLPKPLGLTVSVIAAQPFDLRVQDKNVNPVRKHFENQKDLLMRQTAEKIRGVLKIAIDKKFDAIVLNDFGCLELNNDIGSIIQCYRKVLSEPDFCKAFRKVRIAIDDQSPDAALYKQFLTELDDGFKLDRDNSAGAENNPNTARRQHTAGLENAAAGQEMFFQMLLAQSMRAQMAQMARGQQSQGPGAQDAEDQATPTSGRSKPKQKSVAAAAGAGAGAGDASS